MKKTAKRFLALVLVFVAVFSFSIPAFAEYNEDENRRASDYITSVFAYTHVSNGIVTVYFSITGTRTLDYIGATEIFIFNSNNVCVAIKDLTNTTGLQAYNTIFHSNTIDCMSAQSGEHYHAMIGFIAGDSSGYDTTSFMTH